MNIKTTMLLAVIASTLSQAAQAAAHRHDTKIECEKTKQKIAKLQSKMRQGYRASRGVRMDTELRHLKDLRSKYCR